MVSDLWQQMLAAVQRSPFFHVSVLTSEILLVWLCVLLVLVAITFVLRLFFRRHPVVDRAHRVLIYLLTMAGVLALIIAGILGVLLPVVPGIPFLLAAFLLMRRYHKWDWLEERIALFRQRLRGKVQEKVNKTGRHGRR